MLVTLLGPHNNNKKKDGRREQKTNTSLLLMCLSELYCCLQDQRTLLGRPGGTEEQDIQLNGLGIQQQHAVIDIELTEVFVTPLQEARYDLHDYANTGSFSRNTSVADIR